MGKPKAERALILMLFGHDSVKLLPIFYTHFIVVRSVTVKVLRDSPNRITLMHIKFCATLLTISRKI